MRLLVFALLAAGIAPAGGLRAQTISGGLVSAWTRAPNLEFGLGVQVNALSSTTPLRVFGEFVRGSGDGFGVPCEPLVAEFCRPEPLHDSTFMVTAGVSWVFGVWRNGPWRATAFPEFMLSRIRGTVRGDETDRVVRSQGFYPGIGAGAELSYRPAPTSDVSIGLSTVVRHRMSLLIVDCSDCFNLYDEGFFSGALALSLAYRLTP